MAATLTEILIPVSASIATALVAGTASYFAGKGMRFQEWRLALLRERLLERQRLYAKFLAEADRSQLIVIAKEEKSIDNLMPLLALFAEITLLSSSTVSKCAQQVCDAALSSISREVIEDVNAYLPAKTAFLTAARAELEALEARARRSTA